MYDITNREHTMSEFSVSTFAHKVSHVRLCTYTNKKKPAALANQKVSYVVVILYNKWQFLSKYFDIQDNLRLKEMGFFFCTFLKLL